LSNLNRFPKFLHFWKAYEITLLINPADIAHPTLGMLLRYSGKLKLKFSTDIEEKASKQIAF